MTYQNNIINKSKSAPPIRTKEPTDYESVATGLSLRRIYIVYLGGTNIDV